MELVRPSDGVRHDGGELTFERLCDEGVTIAHVVAAGVRLQQLRRLGAHSAESLRRIGLSSLQLSNELVAHDATSTYGAKHVVDAYLTSPHDAVTLAGSEGSRVLRISNCKLFETCVAAPTEAHAVLCQLTKATQSTNGVASCLRDVPPSTLLACGIDAAALRACGIDANSLSNVMCVGRVHLLDLGFEASELPSCFRRIGGRCGAMFAERHVE